MSSGTVLRGPSVTLRPPKAGDAVDRLALGCHPEIIRMFGGDARGPLRQLTAQEVARWLDKLANHPHAWIVEHEGRLLGEIRLDGLNDRDGRARLAVGFFDPAKLGRGLGREAVGLVLRHAFDELRLHRVDLRVLAFNARAIRCYRRCGFAVEGRERESALVGGQRYDDIIMGTLAHEFRSALPGASG